MPHFVKENIGDFAKEFLTLVRMGCLYLKFQFNKRKKYFLTNKEVKTETYGAKSPSPNIFKDYFTPILLGLILNNILKMATRSVYGCTTNLF